MKNVLKPKYPPSFFLEKLHLSKDLGEIPERFFFILEKFFFSYQNALVSQEKNISDYVWIFVDYLDLIKKQVLQPFTFEPYHQMVRAPYDYHQFGIDFIKPLVKLKESSILGLSHLNAILQHLSEGHNVILLSNHQIEADPQAIAILLEKYAPTLIEKLIFVAGERVLIDPLAVPFSLGCHLLCIYSKRYINHPPESKTLKQHHNHRTMKIMKSLLDEGGHCIYVAPSGGRDRRNENGTLFPAIFDPQSIEMFYLMGQHAHRPTFFYTLALSTYHILPPPETIQTELGENRQTNSAAIHLFFGDKVDMENFPGSDFEDKLLRRKARADYIYSLVNKNYQQLP